MAKKNMSPVKVPMPEQAPAPSIDDMPAEDDSTNDLPF